LERSIAVLGVLFLILGTVAVVLAHIGASTVFASEVQTEATFILALGLVLSAAGSLWGSIHSKDSARKWISTAVVVIVALGSFGYAANTSIVGDLFPPRNESLTLESVGVRIVGGPISQGRDFYVPEQVVLVIGVNNSVIWTNVDVSHHTVAEQIRTFESGNLNPGESYTRSFPKAGVYPYSCDYHPWMKGTVIVKSASS
jgi:hypothetical protein